MSRLMHGQNAFLVNTRRKPLEVGSLGVKSDDREIPILVDGIKPRSWWLIGSVKFTGPVHESTSEQHEPNAVSVSGTAAIALTDDVLVGILSPGDESSTEPSIWWRWPINAVDVDAHGSQGLFVKRPTSVVVRFEGQEISCEAVSRLYMASGSHKPKQESAFAKAIG